MLFIETCFVGLLSCQCMKKCPTENTAEETIGVAHLNQDGLLEVTLRAVGENGKYPVGDAFFVYKKGTPDYELFMKLVGGLKSGETKAIPASNEATNSNAERDSF